VRPAAGGAIDALRGCRMAQDRRDGDVARRA
jgi:hypothetical protein